MFGLEFFEPFPIDRGGVVACSRIDLTTAWYFENENIFNGFRRNHKANIVKILEIVIVRDLSQTTMFYEGFNKIKKAT